MNASALPSPNLPLASERRPSAGFAAFNSTAFEQRNSAREANRRSPTPEGTTHAKNDKNARKMAVERRHLKGLEYRVRTSAEEAGYVLWETSCAKLGEPRYAFRRSNVLQRITAHRRRKTYVLLPVPQGSGSDIHEIALQLLHMGAPSPM
jgi:hypothetical protein